MKLSSKLFVSFLLIVVVFTGAVVTFAVSNVFTPSASAYAPDLEAISEICFIMNTDLSTKQTDWHAFHSCCRKGLSG